MDAHRKIGVPRKKWGSRLGPGAPEGAFQLPVSFSHRRVGSSILASLSEAGGNDPRKVPSKPLPPRSTLCAYRHLKRAHAASNARATPAGNQSPLLAKTMILLGLGPNTSLPNRAKTGLANQFGTVPKLIREYAHTR